ncbi:MAG: glycosyltransferase family 39 protein [Oscillochloridaceae bacterium]|nr:glycosyltransferase family 39 protein [Chloroflexaceae bacterium]MDW8390538.1 glycosyltransferase family 39 protein [Oscillochloridaceae bacterium]
MAYRVLLRAIQAILAALVAAYLIYFADHGLQLLGFAYPLDYGEGPLLAQIERLRQGTPIWRLYADPADPPFLIVNYPPVYLFCTALIAPLTGSVLSAGRLLSLLAALAIVGAIMLLARPRRSSVGAPAAALVALLFLCVPVTREWAVLLRVDMLGIALGLWGLVVLGSGAGPPGPRRTAGAGALLLACLYSKPSLIAAPVAAVGWLLWRAGRGAPDERRAWLRAVLALASVVGIGGGLTFVLLQIGSGGWFWFHVIVANANRWEAALARDFWQQQLGLRWPLAGAALVGSLWIMVENRMRQARTDADSASLALLYTAGGVVTAIGVGKVGAYSNYFLELYAGLVWLAAWAAARLPRGDGDAARLFTLLLGARASGPRNPTRAGRPRSQVCGVIPTLNTYDAAPAPGRANVVARSAFYALLAAALLYYPPLWDADRLRRAGLIEPSPPRLAFGHYGLWADAARERQVLAALTRVGDALMPEVRAAGTLIFTDMPGVAAAAGVDSRLQVFEARQLLDQGLSDERPLLRELANGAIPLAVLDYLGNWLTPGVIEILTHRYAQDGSLGAFDLYRPVNLGAPQETDLLFTVPGGQLHLSAYSLAPPPGAAHEPGAVVALGLVWRLADGAPETPLTVVTRLLTLDGAIVLETERPLLYGVFPPSNWPPGAPVQHVQTLPLPPKLAPGEYLLAAGLQTSEGLSVQTLTRLAVAGAGGAYMGETGQFVPATLRRAWVELGAVERAGFPLTPAVPFAWGHLQCFERVCLELREGTVRMRPLGARLYLAETIRGDGCLDRRPAAGGICAGFAPATERFAALGPVLSGEVERNGWIVQWTEQARLERPPWGGDAALGRLGDETLRLPPGARYRWP